MKRPQFHIAGLVLLIVLAAIALVVFRNLPRGWPGPSMAFAIVVNFLAYRFIPLLSIAVALNLTATVLALTGKGPTRSMAAAYAACGWTYLVVSLQVPWLSDFFESLLRNPRSWALLNQAQYDFPVGQSIPYIGYRVAAHCVTTISVGLAGGLLARWLLAANRSFTPSTTPSTGDI